MKTTHFYRDSQISPLKDENKEHTKYNDLPNDSKPNDFSFEKLEVKQEKTKNSNINVAELAKTEILLSSDISSSYAKANFLLNSQNKNPVAQPPPLQESEILLSTPPKPQKTDSKTLKNSLTNFSSNKKQNKTNSELKSIDSIKEFSKTSPSPLNSSLCPLHSEELTLYCLSENLPCCLECVFTHRLHLKHETIPLKKAGNILLNHNKNIINNEIKNLNSLIENALNKAILSIDYLNSKKNNLDNCLHEEFEKILIKVKNRENELRKTCFDFFDKQKKTIESRISNFKFLKNNINKFENKKNYEIWSLLEHAVFCSNFNDLQISCKGIEQEIISEKDLNFIEFESETRIKLEKMIDSFGNLLKAQISTKENKENKDIFLIDSNIKKKKKEIIFTESDSKKFQKSNNFKKVIDFNFYKEIFYDSSILSKKLRLPQILRTILPENYLEGGSKLLYKLSKDGWGSQIFHTKCDGKAPYICFVKTKKTVFGYYLENNFMQENQEVLCDNFWLFSLKSKLGIKPMRINLRENLILKNREDNPIFGNDEFVIK